MSFLSVAAEPSSGLQTARILVCQLSLGFEITMDDLTAELRLRGLEPPYGAVKQELAIRFAGMDEAMTRPRRRATFRFSHPPPQFAERDLWNIDSETGLTPPGC
jgi:hypothetical protein